MDDSAKREDEGYRAYCTLVLQAKAMRRDGATLQRIADELGISRERAQEMIYRFDKAVTFMDKRQ